MSNIIFGSCQTCESSDIYLFDSPTSSITEGIGCGASGSFKVSVRSQKNGVVHDFSALSDSSWVHVSVLAGMEQISVDVDINTGSAERTATIMLTQADSGKVLKITVAQGYANSAGCKHLVSIDWNFYMSADNATSCQDSGTYDGMKVYESSTMNYSDGDTVVSDYALTNDYSVSYSPEFTTNTSANVRDIAVTATMTRQTGMTAGDVGTYVKSGDSWKITQGARTMGSWTNYSEVPITFDVVKASPSDKIPQSGGSATFSATCTYNIVQRRYNACDPSDYDTQTLTGFSKDVTDEVSWSANTTYNGNTITVGANESTSTVTYTMKGTYSGLTDTATVQQQKKAEITATTYDAKITALSTSIRSCDSLSYKVEERQTDYYDDGTSEAGSYSTASPSDYVVTVKNGALVVAEGDVSKYTGSSSRTLTLSLSNSSTNRYASFGSAASVTQNARTLSAGNATVSKINESIAISQSNSTLSNTGGTNTYTVKYTSTERTVTPYYDACGNYVNSTTTDASPTTVDVTTASTFTLTTNPDSAGSINGNVLTVGNNGNTSARTFEVKGSYNGMTSNISVVQEGTVQISATTYQLSVSAADIKCCEDANYTVSETPKYHWSDGSITSGQTVGASASDYSLSIYHGGTAIALSDVPNYEGTSSRTLTIEVSGTKYENSATTSFTQAAYSATTGSGVAFDNYMAWNANASSSSISCNGGSCNITVNEAWQSGYTYTVTNPCGQEVDRYSGSVETHYIDVTTAATYAITAGSSYASVDSSGKVTVSANETDYDISISIGVTYKGSTETKTITLLSCNCTESCSVSAVTSSSTIEACQNAPSVTAYTKTTTACTNGTTDSGWIQTSNYSVSWSPSSVSGYTGSSSRTITGTVTVGGCGSYTVTVTQNPRKTTTGGYSTYSDMKGISAYASSSLSCGGGTYNIYQDKVYETGYSATVTDACGNYVDTVYSNTGTSYESLSSSSCSYSLTQGSGYASISSDGTLTVDENKTGSNRYITVRVTYNGYSDTVSLSQPYCSVTGTTYEMRLFTYNIECCEGFYYVVDEREVSHWSNGETTYGSWNTANGSYYTIAVSANGSSIDASSISSYTGSTSRTLTTKASGSRYSNSPVTSTCTQGAFSETKESTSECTSSVNALLLTASAYSVDCTGGTVTMSAELEYESVCKTYYVDPCNNRTGRYTEVDSYPTESVTPTYTITAGGAYASVNGSTINISANTGSSAVTIVVQATYSGENETVNITLPRCVADYDITASPSSLPCSGGSVTFTATKK